MADSLEDDSEGDSDRRMDSRGFQKEKASYFMIHCLEGDCFVGTKVTLKKFPKRLLEYFFEAPNYRFSPLLYCCFLLLRIMTLLPIRKTVN